MSYKSINPIKKIICKRCKKQIETVSRTRVYCPDCSKAVQAAR